MRGKLSGRATKDKSVINFNCMEGILGARNVMVKKAKGCLFDTAIFSPPCLHNDVISINKGTRGTELPI